MDFDTWSYGIFRGFDWTYFTVSDNMDCLAMSPINFVLCSAHYPTVREQINYFFNFLAERLHLEDRDLIGITVKSNLLQAYIPGMKRGISLQIVYRDDKIKMETIEADQDSYMNYEETPEAFFRRTGILAVHPSYLLTYIFPEWSIVLQIDATGIDVNKYNKLLPTKVVHNPFNTKVSLISQHFSVSSTLDSIMETVKRVVYSQRTISVH
jgi:hypothetical protein